MDGSVQRRINRCKRWAEDSLILESLAVAGLTMLKVYAVAMLITIAVIGTYFIGWILTALTMIADPWHFVTGFWIGLIIVGILAFCYDHFDLWRS